MQKIFALTFTAILIAGATAYSQERIEPVFYASLEYNTTKAVDLNLFDFDYDFGSIYTKSRILSTHIVFDGVKPILSYNALIQIPLTFAALFNAYPSKSDIPALAMVNLPNGETGYRSRLLDVGLHNSFHLYFGERKTYHQAGLKASFGPSKMFSICLYEEDRLAGPIETFGVMLGYQYYAKPKKHEGIWGP